MMHVSHRLHLTEVDLSDHLIDFVCCYGEFGAPIFAYEAIHFERVVHVFEIGQALVCNSI